MKALLVFLSMILSSSLMAQSDSVFKFALPKLMITQLEKGKDVTYEFENERNIFYVRDSSLTADTVKYKYSVLLADIKKVAVRDGTDSWRGARTGGMIGGAIGLLLGVGIPFLFGSPPDAAGYLITVPGSILGGILVGGIIGSVMGSTIPYFDIRQKFPDDLYAKKEMLKRLFRKHNQGF